MITIRDFHSGDAVYLRGFGATNTRYRQLLLSLGLTLGVQVKVIRKAPFGCPVQVEVRGSSFALRLEEAQYLQWERA